MSALITFSSLPRLAKCPAAGALPHARVETVYAGIGTKVHRVMQRANELGSKEAALAEIEDADIRLFCEQLDFALLPLDPKAFVAEIAIALDLKGGQAREIGRGVERNYGELSPTEIPGTLDVAALVEEDGVYCGDWKVGWSHRRYTAPARSNLQLHAGALALARLYGRSRAIVELIHLRDDGTFFRERHELDEFDLDVIEQALRELPIRVKQAWTKMQDGGVPDVSMGPWCRHCPAFQACPGQTALVRQAALEPEQTAADIKALLKPETASRAYARLKQVQEALKQVHEALYAYAQEAPIPLDDGYVFGPVESSRDELDGDKAREVVLNLWGRDVADVAVEYEASKKSIDRAMRRLYEEAKLRGEKVTLKSFNERTLEAIRRAGGLTTKTKMEVKEHRPIPSQQ